MLHLRYHWLNSSHHLLLSLMVIWHYLPIVAVLIYIRQGWSTTWSHTFIYHPLIDQALKSFPRAVFLPTISAARAFNITTASFDFFICAITVNGINRTSSISHSDHPLKMLVLHKSVLHFVSVFIVVIPTLFYFYVFSVSDYLGIPLFYLFSS